MGLFDINGFENKKDKIKKQKSLQREANTDKVNNEKGFKDNSFNKMLIGDVNPLIKYELINRCYNLGNLLKQYGYENITGGNIYCPFHPDSLTGKPSAKYHEDTDKLYCFSENKIYTAYHALKILYGADMNKLFLKLWSTLDVIQKQELVSKYNQENELQSIDINREEKLWQFYNDKYLVYYRIGKVNYTQYKHALNVILNAIYKDKGNNQ